jgi:hypothetical protein
MPDPSETILPHLKELYGDSAGAITFERLLRILDNHRAKFRQPGRGHTLSERDAILITYADQLREVGTPPLQTLAAFCERHLADLVSGVHLLPFYPSSSDDGFSVIDYRTVDRALGSWQDIGRIGRRFRLMVDAVTGSRPSCGTTLGTAIFSSPWRGHPISRASSGPARTHS